PPNDSESDPTRENVLEEYRLAKKVIKTLTGLELKLSELSGLRQITEQVLKEVAEQKIAGVGGGMRIISHDEIFSRFMLDFYNIGPGDFKNLFPTNKKGDALEGTKEHFQKMQDEAYNL
ncbi:MAG: hypothetical protein HQ538_01500, partial [Parcubacteria group bacterium]|nr:hypothetical protein [Parcubacteria group bacterium]